MSPATEKKKSEVPHTSSNCVMHLLLLILYLFVSFAPAERLVCVLGTFDNQQVDSMLMALPEP